MKYFSTPVYAGYLGLGVSPFATCSLGQFFKRVDIISALEERVAISPPPKTFLAPQSTPHKGFGRLLCCAVDFERSVQLKVHERKIYKHDSNITKPIRRL